MKPATPKPRRIRKFDDLSFTKRDAKGVMLSWFMPNRENSWHEHYGIGETWFDEVAQLARVKPEMAYRTMKYAAREACTKYGDYGHSDGFFDMMARWALVAILANDKLPEIPFKITEMGIPPREGMDFWLAREGKEDESAPNPYAASGARYKDTAIRTVRLAAINGNRVATPHLETGGAP
ncbi:hypothetical protein ACHMW6_15430 [Pseudoduganella sp. UC29_106]|uniref:hypothetical protein n=1 Tax=Pseudoduganella sp. UC29_106 TaxID=3374553 RepID=UPI0037574AA0